MNNKSDQSFFQKINELICIHQIKNSSIQKVRSIAFGVGLSITFLLPCIASAQDKANVVIVEKEMLICVQSNIKQYTAVDDDPIIIFLELCPNVFPSSKDLVSLTQNFFILVKENNIVSNYEVSSILVLNKTHLKCLADDVPGLVQPIEGEDLFVKLVFSACEYE